MNGPIHPPGSSLNWIDLIQRASQIPITDPRWGEAQSDIQEMKVHLRSAIESERASNEATSQSEHTQALTMSPLETALESAGKGASFGLGDLAQKLVLNPTEQESVATSEIENPMAHTAGTLGGIAASLVGPGAAVKLARMGRMAQLGEEGARTTNAINALRLARMQETAQTGRGAAQAAEEATQTAGRVMTDAERAAANEARMAGRASGDPLDEATYARRGGFTPSEASSATGEAAQTASSATPPQPMDMLPSGQPKGLLGSGDPTAAIFALLGAQLAKDKQGNRVQ